MNRVDTFTVRQIDEVSMALKRNSDALSRGHAATQRHDLAFAELDRKATSDAMARFVRYAVALLFGATVTVVVWPAAAQADPAPYLTQLAHRSWRVGDGALPMPPQAIAASPDGYIWIGTDAGLLRFDGVRFAPISGIPQVQILSVLVDRDRSVWAGSSHTLFHLTERGVKPIGPQQRINMIAQAADGTVWLASSRHQVSGLGPSCRVSEDKIACSGNSYSGSTALAADSKDGAWFVLNSGEEICHETNSSVECLAASEVNPPSKDRFVDVLGATERGVLVMLKSDKIPLRLARLVDGRLEEIGELPDSVAATDVESIRVADHEKEIWIGTSNRGIYRFADGKFENYKAADGLSSDDVLDIAIDNEQSVWVVTTDGIDQLYRRPIETWSIKEGLTADSVSSISIGKDGRVYVGNQGGLDIIDGNTVRSIRTGAGLPGEIVQGMYVDRSDTLWVGVDSKLWKFSNGVFTSANMPSADYGAYIWINQDAEGTFYVRAQRKEFRIDNGKTETLTYGDTYKRTTDYVADPKAGMWVAARHQPPLRLLNDSAIAKGDTPPDTVVVYPSLLSHWDYLWCRLRNSVAPQRTTPIRRPIPIRPRLWANTRRRSERVSKPRRSRQ